MKFWILLATFGMTLCGFAYFAAAESAPEKNAATLSATRAQIGRILQKLNHSRRQQNAVIAQVEAIEAELSQQQTQLEATNAQIQHQSEQISKARFDRERLLRRQNLEKQQLAKQVRAAYMTGRRERARLLLSQNSSSKLGRILAYYDYLNHLRLNRVSRAQALQKRLLEVEITQQQLLESHKKLSLEQQAQVQRISAKREARRVVLARINAQLSTQNTQLVSLRDSESHLLRFVKTVQDELPQAIESQTSLISVTNSENADAPPPKPELSLSFPRLKGQLALPTRGTIRSHFRSPKSSGESHSMGILIAAAEGTPVQAVATGRVIFADFEGVYGNMVVIEHSDGYATMYAHLLQNQAVLGAQVEAGEKIGTVGNTGGQSDMGLEFLISRDGDWVDPESWFARAE